MAIVALIVPFLLGLILTPMVLKMAEHYGWMDIPRSDRWHRKSTALMGGIAIFISIVVPMALLSDFTTIVPHIFPDSGRNMPPTLATAMLIGITALFFLGLIDDFRHIKPYSKLIGQICVASVITFFGFRLNWFTSLTIDTLITLLWVVGLTNAFNLIDNMDGLCAGTGAISALFLGLIFYSDASTAALTSFVLAGALLGFLVYNFNPARIFMGDCGSLIIGFSLSMLGIHYSQKYAQNELAAIAVPVLILMVPILDTTMVTIIRLLSGRKASTGGKDHTSHRLVLVGFSERDAVVFLYVVGTISGVSAWFVHRSDTFTSPAVIIPMAIAFVLMAIFLAQIRVYPEKEFSLLRGRPFTPILIELTYKRQIVLIGMDLLLVAFSYYLSYRLRFDSEAFPFYFRIFLKSLPAVIACKLMAFFLMGIYRGIWRFFSTSDVFAYIKASTLGTLLSIAAVTYIYRFEDFSKGSFLIDWLLTTGLLLGTRGSFRISMDTVQRKKLSGQPVLIYGAGRGGELLVREILNNASHGVKPVGFIDDDPLKIGKRLQGCQVLGNFDHIQPILTKFPVNGLLISFNHLDTMDPQKMAKIKQFCRENGLFLKRFSIGVEPMDVDDPGTGS